MVTITEARNIETNAVMVFYRGLSTDEKEWLQSEGYSITEVVVSEERLEKFKDNQGRIWLPIPLDSLGSEPEVEL